MTEEEQDTLLRSMTLAIKAHYDRLEQITAAQNEIRNLVLELLNALKPVGADDLPQAGRPS